MLTTTSELITMIEKELRRQVDYDVENKLHVGELESFDYKITVNGSIDLHSLAEAIQNHSLAKAR